MQNHDSPIISRQTFQNLPLPENLPITLLKLVKNPLDGLVFMNALFATVQEFLKYDADIFLDIKLSPMRGEKNPPCTLPIFPLNGFISICTQKSPIVTIAFAKKFVVRRQFQH